MIYLHISLVLALHDALLEIQVGSQATLSTLWTSQVPQPTCESGLGVQYPKKWEILKKCVTKIYCSLDYNQ